MFEQRGAPRAARDLAFVSASSVNRISRSVVSRFTLAPASSTASGSYFVLAALADRRTRRCASDQVERARHVEGLEPHVQQTRDRFGGRVGVQRREHEVAGEGGLDGDAARLEVADLTDHDDVRVLPQERLQRRRERHPDLVRAPAPG